MNGYTTVELATFFNTNVSNIEQWIAEGRFLGVTNEPDKTYSITDSTFFHAVAGEPFQVREAIAAYEEDQAEWEEKKKQVVSNEEQIAFYNSFFEEKYGGSYKETLGAKKWDELTSEEETDASMWTFFIERFPF